MPVTQSPLRHAPRYSLAASLQGKELRSGVNHSRPQWFDFVSPPALGARQRPFAIS